VAVSHDVEQGFNGRTGGLDASVGEVIQGDRTLSFGNGFNARGDLSLMQRETTPDG